MTEIFIPCCKDKPEPRVHEADVFQKPEDCSRLEISGMFLSERVEYSTNATDEWLLSRDHFYERVQKDSEKGEGMVMTHV